MLRARVFITFLAPLLALGGTVSAAPSAADQKVHFINPKDGATVPTTFIVRFGAEGVQVQPAGKLPREQGRPSEQAGEQAGEQPGQAPTGHHHLIIDGGPVQKGQVIPSDDQHIHYGKGQTEAVVSIAPGKHTLTLQFADGAHRSYGPELSESITVFVR